MSISKSSPTTPIRHAELVWALPVSLATTRGIICYFLFLLLLRCFSSQGWLIFRCDWSSTSRVVPFGDLRVNDCMHLTGAFRSLPRPSSPLSAKASTIRPCFALKFFKDRCNCCLKVTSDTQDLQGLLPAQNKTQGLLFRTEPRLQPYIAAPGILLFFLVLRTLVSVSAPLTCIRNGRAVTGATDQKTKALLFYPVCQRTKEMRFAAAGERPEEPAHWRAENPL